MADSYCVNTGVPPNSHVTLEHRISDPDPVFAPAKASMPIVGMYIRNIRMYNVLEVEEPSGIPPAGHL